MEIWKDIKGYEGYYQVSNLGRILSLSRKVQSTYFNRINSISSRILKQDITKCGYALVTLFKNNKRDRRSVHRIVAETFIPNPNNLPQVNHKDENKLNNASSNLEWCTCEYNAKYSNTISKAVNSRKRKVSQFTLDDTFIKTYESAAQASRETHVRAQSITLACEGKYKTAGNYIWKYLDINSVEIK